MKKYHTTVTTNILTIGPL